MDSRMSHKCVIKISGTQERYTTIHFARIIINYIFCSPIIPAPIEIYWSKFVNQGREKERTTISSSYYELGSSIDLLDDTFIISTPSQYQFFKLCQKILDKQANSHQIWWMLYGVSNQSNPKEFYLLWTFFLFVMQYHLKIHWHQV